MSDGIAIQCPGCSQKLKLAKRPSAGQKLTCPKCQHVIRFKTAAPSKAKPPAASAAASPPPSKKSRPRPAQEEYADFGEDDYGDEEFHDEGDDFDDGYDMEPQTRSRKRAPSASKRKAARKTKKSAANSKVPLIVGGCLVAVGLVAGLVWFPWPAGDETAATGQAASGTVAVMPPMPDVAAMQAGLGVAPPAPAPAGGGQADMKLLPADSEVVVHLNLPGLLSGPLGEIVQLPILEEPIGQMRQQTGLSPEDIASVSVGIAGTMSVSPRVIVVTRTTKPISLDLLRKQLPGARPADPPFADSMIYGAGSDNQTIWLQNDRTVVGGTRDAVLQAARGTASGSKVDLSLANTSSQIFGVFMPQNPEIIFAPQNLKPPGFVPVPGLVEFLTSLQHTRAVGFGLSITNDIDLSINVRASDASGAKQMSDSLSSVITGVKPMLSQMVLSAPPEVRASMQEATKALDQLRISANDSTFGLSLSMPGAGDQMVAQISAQMLPAVLAAQGAATRTQSKNNIKQLLLSMHNYHDVYRAFPPAASVDDSAQPLLSWRVHLLPYLEQNALYEEFHLDEPWDSPHNIALVTRMPDVYINPAVEVEPGKTVFLAVVGENTVMQAGESGSFREISDGSSNTVLLVEANPDQAVTWTAPDDYFYSAGDPAAGLGSIRPEGFNAGLADGSVVVIGPAVSIEDLVRLFQMNDGEQVELF